jgi:hypothetical protein
MALLLPLRDMPVNPTGPKRRAPAALAFFAVLGAFARSASADPTMAECLSANESAIKLRGEHMLRQARDQALVCAASTCPGEVRDVCQKRAAELIAEIPTIVFLAQDGAGHDVVAVKVWMDGVAIGDHLDGTPIPIDPGLHEFRFEIAGQPPKDQSFVISEGQKDRRETITFGTAGALPPPVPLPAPNVAPLPVALTEPVPVATSPASGQRIAGIVVGVAGVVGLGLGAVFGGLAASDWSSAKTYCTGMPSSCTTRSSSMGVQDENSATTMATLSTVSFIAGGVLAAGGVVVFLTAPRGPSSAGSPSARRVEFVPAGGPTGAGFTIRGTF